MPPQTPPGLGVERPPFPASVPEATRQAWSRARHAIEEAEVLAKQAGERLQTYFPAWKVHAEARADSPAWGLVKKADEWKPDLLVVGSHGRSALGRLILGSVSQKVLPIGGVKEKVLAAQRVGMHTVILPKANQMDLREVPESARAQLRFVFAEHMDEVLPVALHPVDQDEWKPAAASG
jgi:hypothetical protein